MLDAFLSLVETVVQSFEPPADFIFVFPVLNNQSPADAPNALWEKLTSQYCAGYWTKSQQSQNLIRHFKRQF